LFNSYADGLVQFGLKPHFNETNIFCYGVGNSKKFFEVIRPSNPKYENRFEKYLSSGGSRVCEVK
jgi:hypothetical protein